MILSRVLLIVLAHCRNMPVVVLVDTSLSMARMVRGKEEGPSRSMGERQGGGASNFPKGRRGGY